MIMPIRKLHEVFVETAVGEEIVVMSLATGDFFSLEGTARAVWLRIDGIRDRAAMLTSLEEEYGSEVDAHDVDAFLDALVAAGFIAG
jgi:pyrroloquinoline quinone biosynthesis protein D